MSLSIIRPFRILSHAVESHRFFVRESFPYSGVAFVRHPLRWLSAYLRFMRYSIKDGIRKASRPEP